MINQNTCQHENLSRVCANCNLVLDTVRNEKYNGWTNYATWRINLEIFDGNDWTEVNGFESISDLADTLKERAEEAVTGYGELKSDSLAVGYANAFLDEVNYYEIAKNIVDDNPKVLTGDKE